MSDLVTTQSTDLARIEHEIARDPRLKSHHTRTGYLADLAAFEKWRAGRFFTRLLVEEYAAELQAAGRAPNSINRTLAALRWYARRLAALVQETPAFSEHEQRERAELVSQAERVASVACVRGKRQPKGRHLTDGELSALMAACENDPTPAGARDAALIALAWSAGLRRDELAGLALVDFTRIGEWEGELLVKGKGDKQRTAYLYNGAYNALVDWLELRGAAAGAIFCPITRGNHLNPGARLSGESLRLILEKRIGEAKVKPLTWHDFRRTFAGNLLDSGTDLATVQKLMGHSDPTTTSNYDRRGDEVKRRAVKSLFVPYRGRLV
jgi:site-specific recombinase XerD